MGKCSLYVLFILLPEGVTLMTMIAMAQEAVPARVPKPYRQPSGPWQPARRHYDRRITCDTASRGPLRGSNRRGRRMFSRLRRSQDRLTRARRRLPQPFLFERKGKIPGVPEEPELEPGSLRLNSLKLFEIVKSTTARDRCAFLSPAA